MRKLHPMAAHPFLSILQKRLRRIRKQTAALAQSCRRKAVHQLRVELKQLRAQLRLLRAVDPEFPYPEIYEPFKVLFNSAGNVRCWQLQAKMLDKAPRLLGPFAEHYRAYAKKRLRRAMRELQQCAKKADVPRWRDLNGELELSAQKCTKGALLAYFQTLQTHAGQILASLDQTGAAGLHELRKIIKEYSINQALAREIFAFDPGPLPGIPEDHAAMDELIGQWHDFDVAVVQLRNDVQNKPAGLKSVLGSATILKAWEKEERVLWQQIGAILHREQSK